jgi:DNA-binding NtrC family response regulator
MNHTRILLSSRLISVLIVDDTADTRSSLEQLLISFRAVGVVASAAKGMQALRFLDQVRPDLVLIDYTMPGMNGLQLGRAIHLRSPRTQIVITSAAEWVDLKSDEDEMRGHTFIPKHRLVRDLPDLVARSQNDMAKAASAF